jgi:uracil-DNA glycosylase family 4
LLKELEIIQPKLVVAMGSIAAGRLGAQYNNFKKVNLIFGSFYVTSIYHPSYILRSYNSTYSEYERQFAKIKEFMHNLSEYV